MVWLEKRHLAFAVANCVFNLRFAAVPVGSCGDSWKLRRVAGEASNMTENALSILIVIFSAQLQQNEIPERKLFIFHLGSAPISPVTPRDRRRRRAERRRLLAERRRLRIEQRRLRIQRRYRRIE